MKVAVAGRTFHAEQLRSLTGLDVGEGQATILLNDLRSYRRRLQEEAGLDVPEGVAARHWLIDASRPASERAHEAVGGRGDPIQAYCDLLEVRWLLSEEAGHDVGDEPALRALAQRVTAGRFGRQPRVRRHAHRRVAGGGRRARRRRLGVLRRGAVNRRDGTVGPSRITGWR